MNEIVLERMVDALQTGDRAGLESVFTEDVSLRASLPHRDVERSGAADAADLMLSWFSGRGEIKRIGFAISSVADIGHVSYRFAVHDPGSDLVIEQKAYCRFAGDRIDSIRLLCSGFRATGAFLGALGEGCATLTPRIASAMRALEAGQVLTVLTDDAAAPDGIAAWSRMTGHEIVAVTTDSDGMHFQLRHK
jgi:TusA-related sulfurtransferase